MSPEIKGCAEALAHWTMALGGFGGAVTLFLAWRNYAQQALAALQGGYGSALVR